MPLGPDKEGVKVNLQKSVVDWMTRVERWDTHSKTIVCCAGLAALRAVSDEDRRYFLRWGKLIDEGVATWEQFEEAADLHGEERQTALERLAGAVPREPAPSSRRGKKSKRKH